MLLQRGRPTRLWGWDRPGQVVRVRLEGAGIHFETQAKVVEREFSCALPALEARGPYRLLVEGSSSLALEDIVAGELWIASGQSNMEWSVTQICDEERELAEASTAEIRCLRVERVPAREPAATVDCRWFTVDANNVGGMTAVGFFFARALHAALGVPIGIVDASWGGTRVEAWTPAEELERVMQLDADRALFEPAPEVLARLLAEHETAMARWEAKNLPADPENQGQARGFAEPNFDDTAQRELELPGLWQRQGMPFNGAVWFRRWVELPPDWAGQDLTLSLGAIDDFDHTYVNGKLVGSHPKGTAGACEIRRRYRVPASQLSQGPNLLAVRVFDHVGEGGFLGPRSELYLERAEQPGERISLAGAWRTLVEREIELVPLSVFATFPGKPLPLQPQNAPSALYNGMLAPLSSLGIRGMIFYQGESNAPAPETYRTRFGAMIQALRECFAQGPFPFYFVELAGFREHQGWPRIREAQAATLSLPETGMASAIDLGDPNDIHPRNKLEVGRRLALLARARTYGESVGPLHGPVAAQIDLGGASCRVRFTEADGLRSSDGAPVRGFELAGQDGVFCAADARIEGECVLVSSPQIAAVAALRYAFRDYVDVNLINAAGLPARPFRTDRD